MPAEICERSKSSPSLAGTSWSTSGSSQLLIADSTTAPIITPQTEPSPPSTTMARMKIENE